MGATEKRRESGAVCRGMGDLSQRDEWGAVYQGWILGVGEACSVFITSLNEGAAAYEICRVFVGDHRVPDRGSDKTSWVLPIPESV